MNRIFSSIARFFKTKRRLTPEEVARSLPTAALEAVLREAAFLRAVHEVEVRELEAGEKTETRAALNEPPEQVPAPHPDTAV